MFFNVWLVPILIYFLVESTAKFDWNGRIRAIVENSSQPIGYDKLKNELSED